MSGSKNKVNLLGRVGIDPEIRTVNNGNRVASFSLATNDSWRDSTSGERVERTEWHRVILFQRLAEIAHEYLKKGSKVYIEGRLQTRKWQDKTTGQDRYTTEIIANEMQMLDSRSGSAGSESPSFATQTTSAARPKREANKLPEMASEAFDDDIPF